MFLVIACGVFVGLDTSLLLLAVNEVLGYTPGTHLESWPLLGGHVFFTMIPELILSHAPSPILISFDVIKLKFAVEGCKWLYLLAFCLVQMSSLVEGRGACCDRYSCEEDRTMDDDGL